MPEIEGLINELQSLAVVAVTQYEPLVNEIIVLKVIDELHIERVLDGVLDFCFDSKMLGLFKRLCRYYFQINPEATVDYIRFYFEMYDSEKLDNEVSSMPL